MTKRLDDLVAGDLDQVAAAKGTHQRRRALSTSERRPVLSEAEGLAAFTFQPLAGGGCYSIADCRG